MNRMSFWINISSIFSTIVYSLVLFLLFPFLAWCSYWCFISHSLHPKKSALLLLVTPGEIWGKKKIIKITDMISSLSSHILPCSQLGLSYTIYTAISHCSNNILLKRSMLQVLEKILQITILINTLFSIKIFSVVFFPKLTIFCFVSAITTKLQISFYFNLVLTLTEFTLQEMLLALSYTMVRLREETWTK